MQETGNTVFIFILNIFSKTIILFQGDKATAAYISTYFEKENKEPVQNLDNLDRQLSWKFCIQEDQEEDTRIMLKLI
jgi:hypothetical protein